MAETQETNTTDNNTYQQYSLITEEDIYLFKEGRHYHMHRILGAHRQQVNGVTGTYFAVWAPNARQVSVIGDFNSWNRDADVMHARWDSSGIWELFVAHAEEQHAYKYYIESHNGYTVEKGDPYGYQWEEAPRTATKICGIDYEWNDQDWLNERSRVHPLSKPISVYELHIGSWRRATDNEGERFMTYRELAAELPGYCKYMNYTHVEFLPVMEHPFYGSWGYQITGYFAPTSRYGTPQDFMYLVDELHKAGIGVILDWVPSHFPTDQHGLGYFDGTHLYEHEDPRKGFHNDWQSFIFNYGRREVRSFLISNAMFWLEQYHIDGLRVDAVASMLYLDYSRQAGEWIPNEHGGRENLDAIVFLKDLNDAVHTHHHNVITIAEESTAWPGVTHATNAGGLGFDLKWMMGWMNDTLTYFSKDPVYRSYHQSMLSFNIYYAFSERFLLPLSHDEVVHGKRSLINKMPGDEWQKFANLRLLYAYMYGHPGAKMIFMGGEFAQRHEWRHDNSLDWHENDYALHNGIQKLLHDLNELYVKYPSLYELNFSPQGFEWIDFNDTTNCVIAWVRKGTDAAERLLFVANFTPEVRHNYRIGVPERGYYEEVLNSDNERYEGSGVMNNSRMETTPIARHGRQHSLSLSLPPLGITILKRTGNNLNF